MGTCLRRDNIWQLLPQPNLHGMDEGLNSKANLGILEAVIKEAKILHNISATEVTVELTGLNLAPKCLTRSYSILPEQCIVNGAVLIKCRGTFWAVQSPREELAFARSHIRFHM